MTFLTHAELSEAELGSYSADSTIQGQSQGKEGQAMQDPECIVFSFRLNFTVALKHLTSRSLLKLSNALAFCAPERRFQERHLALSF